MLPEPIWIPSPNFSQRNGARLDLIVLHDMEGNYLGSRSWFANRHSQVSAHYLLKEDGSEVTQMVAAADKAWACCNFNSRSLNLEMPGFAKQGYSEVEWNAAAELVAILLHVHQIPVKWARGGVGPGFASHYDLGVGGGGHTDPTTDPTVWATFIDRVEASTAKGDFPATYGR